MKRRPNSGSEKGRGLISRRQALRTAGGVLGAAFLASDNAWAQREALGQRWPAGLDRFPAGGTLSGNPGLVGVSSIQDALPTVARLIEDHATEGGRGQLYVSIEGESLADVAWGDAPQGPAMREDSIVSWASAVKPSTCTCLMQLWESGVLDLDDRVTEFIPEFGQNGKENVTLRHLLTHTAHLGGYLGPRRLPPTFAEMVNPIIRAPRQPYGPMGANAELPALGTFPGYNPAGIWIVAEVCRRLDGRRPFERIIREDVFEPIGMMDSWCGMPVEKYREYKAANRFASTYMDSEEEVVKCQPAGGGLSPTRELAFFYEAMLNGGTRNGNRIISPQTVEAMTTPKTGYGYMGIWGLGFNLQIPENVAPAETGGGRAPRRANRYGPHASSRTFGHAGASGMQAYGDPEHGLAVAHIGRAPGMDRAIYEDLELTVA